MLLIVVFKMLKKNCISTCDLNYLPSVFLLDVTLFLKY